VGFRKAHCRVKTMHRNRISGGHVLATLLLTGCASMQSHWPFGKARTPGPEPVNELELLAPAGGSAPGVRQFRERNTLVLDLLNAPAVGQVVFVRRAGGSWPARMAVRMTSQRIEAVEVRGAQRIVLPVSAGAAAVTAELPPGIYDQATQRITLSWGARSAF
jgi:hypothetical protein